MYRALFILVTQCIILKISDDLTLLKQQRIERIVNAKVREIHSFGLQWVAIQSLWLGKISKVNLKLIYKHKTL